MGDSGNYHSNLGPPRSSIKEEANNEYYNLGMLYCGFFVVASAGLVLAIYRCLALNKWWCTDDYPSVVSSNNNNSQTTPTSSSSSSSSKVKAKAMEELESSSIFKYSKQELEQEDDDECVVCLSLFEDGEDVRKLLRCNHSFHVSCIDMWLYSHCHCPLCRTPVGGSGGGGGGGSGGAAAAALSDSSVLPV